MDKVPTFMPNPRWSNFPTHVLVFSLSLLTLILLAPAKIAAQDDSQLYEKHCQGFVPEAQTVGHDLDPRFEGTQTLGFLRASYTGGYSLFNDNASGSNPASKAVRFTITESRKTDKDGVFKIAGRLKIRSQRYASFAGIRTISVAGFWSNSSRRACMVGSGQRYFSSGSVSVLPVSVRFSYPRVSTFHSSMINGTLESLDERNSFEPIRISAAYDGVYIYTRVQDAIRVCKNRNPDVVGDDDVLKGVGACSWNGLGWPLELEYNSGCHGHDCSPFNLSEPKFLPRSLLIPKLQCTPQGHAHGFFEFFVDGRVRWNEVSIMMLIAEGQWDEKKGQLCMVACRIRGGGKKLSEEEDCGISISMMFPRILTVSSRNVVVGHVQSERKVNEPMYFKKITFRGSISTNGMMGGPRDFAELEYEYTKLEKVKRNCSKILLDRKRLLDKKSDWKYPVGNSFADLSFDASVRILAKERGYASIDPFTIGNTFVGIWNTDMGASDPLNVSYNLLNVSYNLQFRSPSGYLWNGPFQAIASFQDTASSEAISSILAEGIYDPQTGSLCMIGCRHVGSPVNNHHGNMDCEILIQVQYAPTNPELFAKENTRGKITSLRAASDPLYFKPMELSSTNVYSIQLQAEQTIWGKDLKIIMGIVSLSYTTLFIIAFLHIKKHPTSLPSVSFLMLTVLSVGNMILVTQF